jgi:hypothetical protein
MPSARNLNARLSLSETLRGEPGTMRDLSFGRLALTIPAEDHEQLTEKYPDLKSRDAHIRSAAWKKFISSAESEPYRVR